MFSSISLRNFKAHEEAVNIPLAPLTIIIGPNNSGKSSLMQALLALAQTIDDPSPRRAFVTSGSRVDLNGFVDILHQGAREKSFGISLTIRPDIAKLLVGSYAYGPIDATHFPEKLDVSFGLSPESKEIAVQRATYWAGNKRLLEVEPHRAISDIFTFKPTDAVAAHFSHFLPTFTWEDTPRREAELRRIGIAIRSASNLWEMLLRNVFRTGPVRTRVPWYSGVGTSSSSDFGLGGANLIEELGNQQPRSSRREVSAQHATTLGAVNQWIAGRTGMPKRLRVKDVDRAGTVRSLLCDEQGGAKNINAAAMGEGVSQVLPVISRAFSGRTIECLFIEQPEIHLHPALQGDLGDLFIYVVAKTLRQMIIETHSEHLLMRIRRRVAEGTIPREMISILFVEREASKSVVKQIELNERGHFTDWPKGFFDESYREAMALAEAASKKPRSK